MHKIILFLIFIILYSCHHKKPELSLSTYMYNFDLVKEDSIYRGSSIIKNTGNDTLKILDIDAGCGCTRAVVTKKIIPPNDTCILNFTYNTKGKEGLQEEFICITANTDSLVYLLQFKALVQQFPYNT